MSSRIASTSPCAAGRGSTKLCSTGYQQAELYANHSVNWFGHFKDRFRGRVRLPYFGQAAAAMRALQSRKSGQWLFLKGASHIFWLGDYSAAIPSIDDFWSTSVFETAFDGERAVGFGFRPVASRPAKKYGMYQSCEGVFQVFLVKSVPRSRASLGLGISWAAIVA